jgi:hypothetical protein
VGQPGRGRRRQAGHPGQLLARGVSALAVQPDQNALVDRIHLCQAMTKNFKNGPRLRHVAVNPSGNE